jgi:LPXTG-site transpeptidase (sortase) family protein
VTERAEPIEAEAGTPEVSGASTGGLATRYVAPSATATLTDAERVQTMPPAPPELLDSGDEERALQAAQPEQALGRRSFVLLRAGLAASTVGLCLLLFVGYVYTFSTLQQQRAQHILLNEFTAGNRTTILTAKSVPEGEPAGVLTVPALRLTQVIVEGTTATDLLKGPGLMPGTARPGSLGNSVLAGHRTIAGSPFARLNRLRPGDRIVVVTPQGRYVYRVLAVGTTRTGQRDPTSPNRHPRLTLVTSSPAGNGRLYVVAALRTTANRLPIPRHPPTPAERGLSGDSAAVVPSILWGLLLAAAFAITFYAYWRFRGRHWSVYLLSTPVLLAITFVWYGNLIRLLPGTM